MAGGRAAPGLPEGVRRPCSSERRRAQRGEGVTGGVLFTPARRSKEVGGWIRCVARAPGKKKKKREKGEWPMGGVGRGRRKRWGTRV